MKSNEVFAKYKKGKDAKSIGEYIWKNVEKMQSNNSPVSGAPKRDIMPQTDDANNWKELSPNTMTLKEIKRFKQLAGIKIF